MRAATYTTVIVWPRRASRSGREYTPSSARSSTLSEISSRASRTAASFDSLAKIDEAAGDCPSRRKIVALDQNDLVADLGNYVGGYRRTFRPWHDAILTWR